MLTCSSAVAEKLLVDSLSARPILNVPPVALTTINWISSASLPLALLPFWTETIVAIGAEAMITGVPRPRLSSNENAKVSSFVVSSKFAFSVPGASPIIASSLSSSDWMLSKLMSLKSNLPSPFASGCEESPLLKSGSTNLCLNDVAKSSASPIDMLVNGIGRFSAAELAIEPSIVPSCCNIPSTSLGPMLLKWLIRSIAAPSALKVTVGDAGPVSSPKMVPASDTVKVALTIGVAALPEFVAVRPESDAVNETSNGSADGVTLSRVLKPFEVSSLAVIVSSPDGSSAFSTTLPPMVACPAIVAVRKFRWSEIPLTLPVDAETWNERFDSGEKNGVAVAESVVAPKMSAPVRCALPEIVSASAWSPTWAAWAPKSSASENGEFLSSARLISTCR